MLFNSASFLFLFLPTVWLAYRMTLRSSGPYSATLAKWVLLLASITFYGVWDWRYVPGLLASIAINHQVARAIARSTPGRSRKVLLLVGIVVNTLLLVYFKHAAWLVDLVLATGAPVPTGVLQGVQGLVLPLGISFYTFHVISFLVDTYRGQSKPTTLLDSACYFLFFPHLVAGPILSHRNFAPQLVAPAPAPPTWVARGLFLIVIGLAKKLLIADTIAKYIVEPFWPAPGSAPGLFDAWMAVAGYSAQLYYDFSAYCEIALGLAMLFGFRFPVNFHSPYQAPTIQAFWTRWHITLGRFLRDYLYIPLGGNRKGAMRSFAAVILTFAVGGLWHGAGVTYLVWGLLHGSYIIGYRLWQRQSYRLPHRFAVAITLFLVMLAWVPFRAVDLDQVIQLWRGLTGLNGIELPAFLAGADAIIRSRFLGLEAFPLVALYVWMLTRPNAVEVASKLSCNAAQALRLLAVWSVVVFSLALPSTFLYFQF